MFFGRLGAGVPHAINRKGQTDAGNQTSSFVCNLNELSPYQMCEMNHYVDKLNQDYNILEV